MAEYIICIISIIISIDSTQKLQLYLLKYTYMGCKDIMVCECSKCNNIQNWAGLLLHNGCAYVNIVNSHT